MRECCGTLTNLPMPSGLGHLHQCWCQHVILHSWCWSEIYQEHLDIEPIVWKICTKLLKWQMTPIHRFSFHIYLHPTLTSIYQSFVQTHLAQEQITTNNIPRSTWEIAPIRNWSNARVKNAAKVETNATVRSRQAAPIPTPTKFCSAMKHSMYLKI